MECVYLILCEGNGDFYIGATEDVRMRWNRHRSLLRADKPRCNRRLYAAAKLYGLDSMRIHIIECCRADELPVREQYWLDRARTHYPENVVNANGPASNPTLGTRLSEARRERLRALKLGRSVPALRGDNNPSRRPEMRARMSGASNPAKRADVRLRMSRRSGVARRVTDVATGDTWRTMSDCANALGVSVAAVHAAATGKNPSVKGRVICALAQQHLRENTK